MKTIISSIALAAVTASLANAGVLIYSRPLPTTTQFTNVAGPQRSNTAFGNNDPSSTGSGFIQGDRFTVPNAQAFYTIDSISVWMITNTSRGTPQSEFTGFVLYGGADPGTADTPYSFTAINIGQPTITRERYLPSSPGDDPSVCGVGGVGQDYSAQGSASCLGIYRLTFSTNVTVAGGSTYTFAADGFAVGSNVFYSHFTDSSLPSQTGATGSWLNFDGLALGAGYYTMNSGTSCVASPTNFCVNWVDKTQNKNTNINVEVTALAADIPEPSTYALVAIGALGILAARRRRQ